MTSLRSYQRQLLVTLQDPACPRFGVIAAPSGSGIRRPVEIHLRRVASRSLVLVLCSRNVIMRQWAERIRADESVSVTVLDSASAALELLEGRRARTGVLLATYARAQHGPSSRALSELDFGLVVHDVPPRSFSREVEHINSRAQHAIALVDHVGLDSKGWQWPVLWMTTHEQLVAGGFLSPVSFPIEATLEERALREEAIGVLREHAADRNLPFVLPSDSMPELHARLLTLTSDASEMYGLGLLAWRLLDRMEDVSAADSRLTALDSALSQAVGRGARCVVLAATQMDARYIADHLDHTGRPSRAVLSSTTALADQQSALAELSPGECLVATHAVLESADDWPADAAVILWPAPSNKRVLDELFWIAEGRDITVTELSEAYSKPTLGG